MLYRLQEQFKYGWFKFRTRGIVNAPSIACDPAAQCEVHTMLGIRDVPLYRVAIKSLVRWLPGIAVVVHSDGSLDPECRESIARLVPGVRIVEAAEADRFAADALRDRPGLLAWRSRDAAYRRLIDTELWTRTPKRIILDADVLVLREPSEVVQWVKDGSAPLMLGQPPDDSDDGSRLPAASEHVQKHFRYKVPQLAQLTGLPPRFLQGTTAGFYCCTNQLTFDKIELLLGACESIGLPMTQWGGDQCIVIYLLSASGGTRLDDTRCFNFDPSRVAAAAGAEVIHFYGTHRFYRGIYPALAASVCKNLRSASSMPASAATRPLMRNSGMS